MEIVTLIENVMRGESFAAKNARQTHCLRGHEFTPDNTYIDPSRGERVCRECKRIRDRQRKDRQMQSRLEQRLARYIVMWERRMPPSKRQRLERMIRETTGRLNGAQEHSR
jgi:hypothetical protein